MPTTKAFVSKEAGFAVVEEEVERPACGPMDVVVEIIASGLCHSDLAMMTNAWGMSQFPLVGGHEGVGRIVEVGANVGSRKVGDMVGVGWMRNSCQDCRVCLGAQENLCDGMMVGALTAFFTQNGTFAKHCVVPAKFATKIPDGLDPAAVSPLLCAGVTVWNPLNMYANHMSRVAVNAIGGLGHIAIQFAAKMGMDVVGMSRGMKKKDAAISFGATAFIDTKDPKQLEAAKGSFDLIIDTAPCTGDMSMMLPLLAAGGKYVAVGAGADGKKMEVGTFDILAKSNHIGASGYGSLSQLSDMMIFAARHGIVSDCEKIPMSKLPEALEKLKSGNMSGYRIVLTRD